MTISTTVNRVQHLGNGSSKSFAFGYFFEDPAHLQVFLELADGTVTRQTLTTHYTVSGTRSDGVYKNGGAVTFVTAPPAGSRVTIFRAQPLTQTLALDTTRAFRYQGFQLGLDRVVAGLQRLLDEANRSAKLPPYVDPALPALTFPAPVPSGYVRWNAAGTALEAADLGDAALGVPADGSVSTPKIADEAVTLGKLGADAIAYIDSLVGAGLTDGSVTVAKLATDALALMEKNPALISALSFDTGGGEPAYTGGVVGVPTTSGRSTDHISALLASQNCRSQFVRSVNIGSIYCWAKGNVSGNYSSRQCNAWVPQSVNLGSEECRVYGGFRGANLASIFSTCENESNANLGTRYSHATGRNGGNLFSTDASAGRGYGAEFTVAVSGGAVTGVTIVSGGTLYVVGDALRFYDREGAGTGASAIVASVDANGAILTIGSLVGGSSYSSNVDANIDNGTGDYSFNIGTFSNSRVYGTASGNLATESCRVGTGGLSVIIAGQNNANDGAISAIIASAGASISAAGSLSAAIAANNSQVTAAEAVVFGRRTINPTTRELAGGDSGAGSAASSNRKWSISNATGIFKSITTFSASGTFADFGEYFENRDRGVIPYGTIVLLDGDKVVPWDGEGDILGVVSATVAFMGNDADFQWQGRYLKGEFGETLYGEPIPDPDWKAEIPDPAYRITGDPGEVVPTIPNPAPQAMVRLPIENPAYDPTRELVARSERPEEWSPVGLLGQVFTRFPANPAIGDVIGGRLTVMAVTTPFDPAKGYAVAKCFIR